MKLRCASSLYRSIQPRPQLYGCKEGGECSSQIVITLKASRSQIYLQTNTNCEVDLSYFCIDLELLDNRIACFRDTLPSSSKSLNHNSKYYVMANLNMTELLIILGVVLLLFGGKKIPELMRGVGKGIREFNNAKNSVEEELKEGMREYDKRKIEEKRAAE